jgi:hypothetical protein
LLLFEIVGLLSPIDSNVIDAFHLRRPTVFSYN